MLSVDRVDIEGNAHNGPLVRLPFASLFDSLGLYVSLQIFNLFIFECYWSLNTAFSLRISSHLLYGLWACECLEDNCCVFLVNNLPAYVFLVIHLIFELCKIV